MPSNYDAIRESNLKEYGHGTRHLEFLGRLYTHREHGLYELLQNAEDAGASRVRFQLTVQELEVWHDGRPFDRADVTGVCGVGEGTKAGDLTKIGKFGIGFKAVYAYTMHPEIHSGDEHFMIEAFVRPHGVVPRLLEPPWTTLQVFPFDRPDLAPAEAFHELRSGLRQLGARTLLFLRNITTIEWQIEGAPGGSYHRASRSWGPARHIALTTRQNGESAQERWLVFARMVETTDHEKPTEVEIAWRTKADAKNASETIEPISDSTLVVFFPTDKVTGLGFLVQGPYRTTPARDNIPARDQWNDRLITETAFLLVTALHELREMGLMTATMLQTLPIRATDFPDGSLARERSMFRPLFDVVREALREEPLLPTSDGRFVAAKHGKLSRGAALRKLLDQDRLRQLYGEQVFLTWVSDDITLDRMPDLYHYLRQVLSVDEVTPELFATRISDEFLAQQSDEWLAEFYSFLTSQDALWRSRGPLRRKAILRLEDNQHVSPFGADDRTPNAFLPPYEATDFPTVKRSIVHDPNVRAFLVKLGLSEPDIGDEVIQNVLPKYARSTGLPHGDEHLQDLNKVLRALSASEAQARTALLTRVRKQFYLLANEGSTDGELWYIRPGTAYLPDPTLEMYFAGNPDAYFLSTVYPEAMHDQLIQLGVQRSVRLTQKAADASGYVIMTRSHGSHQRGVAGFDPKCEIHGLQFALEHINDERAAFIWNSLLSGHTERLRGIVESASRRTYEKASREEVSSPVGDLVSRHAWLPGPDGTFQAPADLALDDLPETFVRDEVLAATLGMRANKAKQLADELGLDLRHLDLLLRNRSRFETWIKGLEANDISPTPQVDGHEDEETVPINWPSEVAERFSRTGSAINHSFIAPGPVPNAAQREELLQTNIREAVNHEPRPRERFRRVPRTIWESKNNEVRPFLQEQYGGHCQLCQATFAKRDGMPYFEGLYLVPASRARWLDRAGNVLCLCATCSAKFEHGAVEADNILDQIAALRTASEGGDGSLAIRIRLAGEHAELRFSERHMLELRAIAHTSAEE